MAKINDKNENRYYIRYVYTTEVRKFFSENSFNFSIYFGLDTKNPIKTKTDYDFKSNFNPMIDYSCLKILAIGNLKKNVNLPILVEKMQEEDPDLVLFLGNYVYDIEDNFGVSVDDFFNVLEPLISTRLSIFLPGAQDMIDEGNFLMHRLR